MPVSSFPRLLIVTLIVAVCFACTGCGGGGGGSSSGGSTPSYLKLPALSATVPTAAGGPSVRGDLRGQVSASEYSVTIVNPEDGSTLKTITATSIAAAGNNLTINFGSNITVVAPSKGVIKLVVARLSVAILHGYVSSPLPEAGETKTTPAVDVGSDDLAKALAFEEWNTRYAAGTFDNFVNQVENEFTFENKLASLTEKIETTLITLVTGDEPPATFSWETVDAVKTLADDFKDVAAPPTTGGVGIPANIQIAGFVASPATQVRCAIESILNLANIGMPSRFNASVAPTSPAVPALTPILGSNAAIDIKGMRNMLMAALQGGTSATEGPIADLSSPTSSISFTSNSVEIVDKAVGWVQGSGFVSQNIKRQLIEGVEVTASNGIITQIKFNANSKFTNEKLNPATGAVENRVTFLIVSGISGTASYKKEASVGFYSPYNPTIGVTYTFEGEQKYEATINGPIVADVTVNDILNDVMAGGRVTLSGVSGTISQARPFYYGKWGRKDGENFIPWSSDEFIFTGEFVSGEVIDNLVFSGNALSLSVTAESTAKDVVLKELSLNLSGIAKITTGEYEGAYKVGGISGKVVAAYNGTSYKDYGYIKQLEILISNASFDPTALQAIPDGVIVTLKKTNSDNTVDTLTYTMVNGKATLAGATVFQGGGATVTTLTNGDVKITGTLTFQDPTAKKMVMAYEALRANTQDIDGVRSAVVATASLTIDSTTTRKITYAYIAAPAPNETGIRDGLYLDGSGSVLGHFNWFVNYWYNYQFNNKVISTDISGWQDFLLER